MDQCPRKCAPARGFFAPGLFDAADRFERRFGPNVRISGNQFFASGACRIEHDLAATPNGKGRRIRNRLDEVFRVLLQAMGRLLSFNVVFRTNIGAGSAPQLRDGVSVETDLPDIEGKHATSDVA